MTIPEEVFKKLETIVRNELPVLERNAIIPRDGHYEVFGVYFIYFDKNRVIVKRHDNVLSRFSSVRTALSWCIAEKFRKYDLSQEIQRLDSDVERIKNDVKLYQGTLPRTTDLDRYLIIKNKLDNKRGNLFRAQERLEKCVNLAKYFQLRGFNNELARTQYATVNTKNRSSDRKSTRPKN